MPYLRDFSLLFWYNESIKIKAVFPMMKRIAAEEALFFEEQLKKEINEGWQL